MLSLLKKKSPEIMLLHYPLTGAHIFSALYVKRRIIVEQILHGMFTVGRPTRDHGVVPAVLVAQVFVQTAVLFVLVGLLLALRLPGRLSLCAGRAGQTAVQPALQR